jgi:prepilin-type N-terminal cleavage/methylation domain-containing protein
MFGKRVFQTSNLVLERSSKSVHAGGECRPSGAVAFTLTELMVAMGVAGILALAVMSFFLYTSQSFAAMANYAELDKQSQLAADKLTQQIRQVNQLTSYTTTNGVINSLTFRDFDSASLTFSYDPGTGTLARTKNGTTGTMLANCTSLRFQIFQRNVQYGTFDAVTTAVATNCKLVEVTWTCAKSLLGSLTNTQTMQTTKVTLRQAP